MSRYILLAILLVFLRSAVWVFWEASLNSDQAIVGLMAKHLSEFRAFPLFFYGQNYMLGVQSWIAVPFFWMGGPTVAMLRLPLVLINAGSRRRASGRVDAVRAPASACLPRVIAIHRDDADRFRMHLSKTLGASVEPFAYVLILWGLRRRPAWFGAVFCVAHLHREFVIFAAPALAVTQWFQRDGGRWLKPRARAGGFAGVWILVDVLKRTVNAYGPAGGDYVAAPLSLQAQQILKWLSFEPAGVFRSAAPCACRGAARHVGAHVIH